MPKKVFATEEEKRQWQDNRPAQLKAYNKAFKEKPEYKEWQKNYRADPEFQKRHKKYMRRYNKRKAVKAKQSTPQAKAKQHENYLIRKKEGRNTRYNPEYYKDQSVKDHRNKARREKRKREKEEREQLLALMSERERNLYLAREKKTADKIAKAKKVKKAFEKLEANKLEAEQTIIEKQRKAAEKIARQAFKASVDKAMMRILQMRDTRAQRLAGFKILPLKIVGARLQKYREVIDEIREEINSGLGILEVA